MKINLYKKLVKDILPPRLQEIRLWKIRGEENKEKYKEIYKHYYNKFEPIDINAIVGDFGCGPYGGMAYVLKNKVYPIDINARAYNKMKFSPCEIIKDSRICESKSIDVMYCCDAIDHTNKPGLIINEIHRLLKPGGILYFYVHFRKTGNKRHHVWDFARFKHEFKNFCIEWHRIEPKDEMRQKESFNNKINGVLYAKLTKL